MVGTFERSLAEVRSRVLQAALRAHRRGSDIQVMAVTKGFPRETVREAIEAGAGLFGENRVQEAESKFAGIEDRCELHLIGHLQTNKARLAAGLFHCVQSIDSVHTARALHDRCLERGRTMDVLLELNTSGEPTKWGFRGNDELKAALEQIEKLSSLRVRGLMTVGPLTDDRGRVRASFAALRMLFEELGAGRQGFAVLSMGMSSDFEIAVEEGATMVRLGTALFGPRVAG